jgi:hypothetical protein
MPAIAIVDQAAYLHVGHDTRKSTKLCGKSCSDFTQDPEQDLPPCGPELGQHCHRPSENNIESPSTTRVSNKKSHKQASNQDPAQSSPGFHATAGAKKRTRSESSCALHDDNKWHPKRRNPGTTLEIQDGPFLRMAQVCHRLCALTDALHPTRINSHKSHNRGMCVLAGGGLFLEFDSRGGRTLA